MRWWAVSGWLISAKVGGRLGAESETSPKALGRRPLWPFPVISFVPGRPAALTLGNSLHSPEPHFPKFVKWTW